MAIIQIQPIQLDIISRMLFAAFVGLIIGLEREKRKVAERSHGFAGLRTHMLVCMASAIVVSASITISPENPLLGVASIMTGIGFLGAGTMIMSGGKIRGLTNAASIWVTAAIGIIVGLGFYISALLSAIVTVLVLELKRFETLE